MHSFYDRAKRLLALEKKKSINDFIVSYGYEKNRKKIYADWDTHKLPQGNVLENLCDYLGKSPSYMLKGIEDEIPEHLRGIVEELKKRTQDEVNEIKGAMKLMHLMDFKER